MPRRQSNTGGQQEQAGAPGTRTAVQYGQINANRGGERRFGEADSEVQGLLEQVSHLLQPLLRAILEEGGRKAAGEPKVVEGGIVERSGV